MAFDSDKNAVGAGPRSRRVIRSTVARDTASGVPAHWVRRRVFLLAAS